MQETHGERVGITPRTPREDAGKSLHRPAASSAIDLNRAGRR